MKFLLATALMFAAQNSFAAGAVSYTCVGKDKTTNNAVAFSLEFSDSAPNMGYTNEAITVTKNGGEVLEKPLIFQLHGAKNSNNCKLNSDQEIYMFGGFSMDPTPEGDIAAYQVSFKSDCAGMQFDVVGYCFFE